MLIMLTTQEGGLRVQGQSNLQSETLSQKHRFFFMLS